MRIFANGGGSGERISSIYERINSLIDHNKPVLYIPLAMEPDKHPYDGCYEWIKQEIASINISNIVMPESFDELALLNYDDYSFVFIGGGNTFRLLKGLKDSGAFLKLKDFILRDGIVFGGSAGAVIMGKDVSCSMDENYVELKDTRGFDLLNGYSVFPHYTNFKSKLSKEENEERLKIFTDRIINYTKDDLKMIAIPEEDTVIVDNGGMQIVGYKPYYKFEKGVMQMVKENLWLKEVTENDGLEGLKYLQDIVNEEGIMVAPAPKDINEATYPQWLKTKADTAKGINMPEGYIPCTTYWVMLDDKIIGLANIKHYLNDFLRKKGGHLGLSLAKEYRGKGIGYETTLLLIDKARSEFGIDDILLTNEPDNVASRKLCEKLGAELTDIDEHCHYWIRNKQK